MPVPVKIKYRKEVVVEDELTVDEIERIALHGVPDRIDCMADEIDNTQPLEFVCWSFIPDNYFNNNSNNETPKSCKKVKHTNVLNDVIMPIICALLFGIVFAICKQNIIIGIIAFALYIPCWYFVQAVYLIMKCIIELKKEMKGDN